MVVQQLAILVTHYPETKVDPVAQAVQTNAEAAVRVPVKVPAVQFVVKLATAVEGLGVVPKIAAEVSVLVHEIALTAV